MGSIIEADSYAPERMNATPKPIVYCCTYRDNDKSAISINILLAEKLLRFPANRRTMYLEQCFNQVLETLSCNVFIKDFDVMFNPNYQVDVLKIMIAAFKKNPFSLIWPGKYKDGKLFYADEGSADYKVFNIEEYDITCIV